MVAMVATSGTIGLQLTISSGGDATLHVLGLDLECAIPDDKLFVSAQFVDRTAGIHARHARRRTKALKGVVAGTFTHLDLNQFLVWGSKDEVADCESGTLTVRLHKKQTLGSTVLARANLPVRELLRAGLVTCKLGLPADGTVPSLAQAEEERQCLITPSAGNDTAMLLQFDTIMSSPHANFSKLTLPQIEELLVAAHGAECFERHRDTIDAALVKRRDEAVDTRLIIQFHREATSAHDKISYAAARRSLVSRWGEDAWQRNEHHVAAYFAQIAASEHDDAEGAFVRRCRSDTDWQEVLLPAVPVHLPSATLGPDQA